MLNRFLLAGLLAMVAAPALGSDITYDERALSTQDSANQHKAQGPKKIAKSAKSACSCEHQASAPAPKAQPEAK